MGDTCCWHLGCHYSGGEPQGGSSPCPAPPAVPLSSTPSSSIWVLQRLQWDCPLLGIVAKLTDLFPPHLSAIKLWWTDPPTMVLFLLSAGKKSALPVIDCFVGVAVGEVGDCKRIKFTTMLTENNQLGWIKRLRGRHWVSVSQESASVNPVLYINLSYHTLSSKTGN